MTLDEEFAKYQNQGVLVPGQAEIYRGQCFQWFDFVLHDVYELPYFYATDAIDIWESPSWLLDHFDKITDGSIKKGDIVVFNTLVGSSSGHVDVAMQDGTTSNFQGADSNWGGNKTVHLVQHSNSNFVLGSLRLKGGDSMQDNPNEGDLVNIYNSTGWPGHRPNSNDIAYWCQGTGNPHYPKPNDVWTALVVEVSNWTKANNPSGVNHDSALKYVQDNLK